MPNTKSTNDLYVVVISSLEEKIQLIKLCEKHNIRIKYDELKNSNKFYPIWGVSKDGVALIGTQVARFTKKNHILHSLIELDKVLLGINQ